MLSSMFLYIYIPQVLSYVLYTCCLRARLNRIPLLNGFAMTMNASMHNHAQYEELEARIAAGDEDALIPGCNSVFTFICYIYKMMKHVQS